MPAEHMDRAPQTPAHEPTPPAPGAREGSAGSSAGSSAGGSADRKGGNRGAAPVTRRGTDSTGAPMEPGDGPELDL